MWRFPLILFPWWIPFASLSWSPLLTWNPPCCDRIRPSWSQVARKLISPFPSLPICSPSAPHSEIPNPWGFSELMRPFTRMTLQRWLPDPAHYCMYIQAWIALREVSLSKEFWTVRSTYGAASGNSSGCWDWKQDHSVRCQKPPETSWD